MKEKIKKRAKIMKDQPMTAKEEVVFWTEYVLRHNGAKHLVSPARYLPWSVTNKKNSFF